MSDQASPGPRGSAASIWPRTCTAPLWTHRLAADREDRPDRGTARGSVTPASLSASASVAPCPSPAGSQPRHRVSSGFQCSLACFWPPASRLRAATCALRLDPSAADLLEPQLLPGRLAGRVELQDRVIVRHRPGPSARSARTRRASFHWSSAVCAVRARRRRYSCIRALLPGVVLGLPADLVGPTPTCRSCATSPIRPRARPFDGSYSTAIARCFIRSAVSPCCSHHRASRTWAAASCPAAFRPPHSRPVGRPPDARGRIVAGTGIVAIATQTSNRPSMRPAPTAISTELGPRGCALRCFDGTILLEVGDNRDQNHTRDSGGTPLNLGPDPG